jgi:hypothetical protein
MTNPLSKNLISPILVAITVWVAGVYPVGANTGTSAEPTAEQIEQATQATEIRPGDWAYQTLQALSSKYSCGNNATGNKVLSREEFATSLNGCVQSMEQLVARRKLRKVYKKRRYVPAPTVETAPPVAPEVVSPPPEPTPVAPIAPPEPQVEQEETVTQQDLDRLKGLVQSFSADLQGIDSRVQALDDKVATLKAQAFSATTKLNGEVIFSVSGYGGRGTAIGTNERNGNILADRVRLNFDTSFTGKDLLRTRLQSRNITSFNSGVTGSNSTRLGYDGDSTNNTSVSLLKYNFPLSPDTKIITEVVGAEFNDEFYNFNPALESSGGGAVSRFGRFNPIYRLSNDGAAFGIEQKFGKELGLSLAYGIPNNNSASVPLQNGGLFNGSNVYFGQLRFTPVDDLNIGVAYARSYSSNGANLAGGTVGSGGTSATAENPFGSSPTTANHYSFLASYKLSPGFIVSGWAGFTESTRETAAGGNASSSNYAVTLAFPDFGQKGNVLGFVFGIPPKLNTRTGTGLGTAVSTNPDTSYHLEALYKMKFSDNLSITPGLILITNPEHNSGNPTEYVGTIRTTFKF